MTKISTRSQAYQDYFAKQICGTNGTYIEIGANHPKNLSNTYNLECFYNWRGFSIELDRRFQPKWERMKQRKNNIFWHNAITFDYLTTALALNLGTHINYLSCDIEPPENTFKALKAVLEQGLTFDCITFEHDLYQSDVNYDEIVTDYLLSKNYKVAVKDVYFMVPEQPFETWFVSDKINFKETTFENWKKDLNI
jgi:hypothetical protein